MNERRMEVLYWFIMIAGALDVAAAIFCLGMIAGGA